MMSKWIEALARHPPIVYQSGLSIPWPEVNYFFDLFECYRSVVPIYLKFHEQRHTFTMSKFSDLASQLLSDGLIFKSPDIKGPLLCLICEYCSKKMCLGLNAFHLQD